MRRLLFEDWFVRVFDIVTRRAGTGNTAVAAEGITSGVLRNRA